MATLTGRLPKNTFKNLLQVDNNNNGLDATLRFVEDGGGAQGPYRISTTTIEIPSGKNFLTDLVKNLTGEGIISQGVSNNIVIGETAGANTTLNLADSIVLIQPLSSSCELGSLATPVFRGFFSTLDAATNMQSNSFIATTNSISMLAYLSGDEVLLGSGANAIQIGGDVTTIRPINASNGTDLGTTTNQFIGVFQEKMALKDGITAPATDANNAQMYVDSADGDLKIKFSDGTVKTITTDT